MQNKPNDTKNNAQKLPEPTEWHLYTVRKRLKPTNPIILSYEFHEFVPDIVE